jgi:hypothetical protein
MADHRVGPYRPTSRITVSSSSLLHAPFGTARCEPLLSLAVFKAARSADPKPKGTAMLHALHSAALLGTVCGSQVASRHQRPGTLQEQDVSLTSSPVLLLCPWVWRLAHGRLETTNRLLARRAPFSFQAFFKFGVVHLRPSRYRYKRWVELFDDHSSDVRDAGLFHATVRATQAGACSP